MSHQDVGRSIAEQLRPRTSKALFSPFYEKQR
ncbi:hypothetical protein OOU_Y34scaffold00084g5 [Pyricularia oryzae Y34]|uniref:Uncharacterized protein n=4 Tax=Pyricularia oryzae TaxID=318829 RepID=Q2KEX4_PYRO7|nr:hypothetical protein MGCH7_ch7g912 [Pyricularia oryzae 70-15]ELQ44511.1 hypothetical protein OOU_Y34scaffold00084g5 [Pyricularia oryzae Y34]QBZ65560.1 hypothetical protein PoMZ_12522 [Pyricularia oryzae]